MEKEYFLKAIKEELRDKATSELIDFFRSPPGRKPREKVRRISAWYNLLDESGKKIMRDVVEEAVDSTLFSFFCILDGVRFLENSSNKSKFELYSEFPSEKKVLLNDEQEPLHDLYNNLVLKD